MRNAMLLAHHPARPSPTCGNCSVGPWARDGSGPRVASLDRLGVDAVDHLPGCGRWTLQPRREVSERDLGAYACWRRVGALATGVGLTHESLAWRGLYG